MIGTRRLGAVLWLATACAPQSELKKLVARVDSLASALDSVNFRVDSVAMEVRIGRPDSSVLLTPGSSGYSLLQSEIGQLTVSLDDVAAYANGSRVRLKFGNLTSATIDGAEAVIQWGSVNEHGFPQRAGSRERRVQFGRPLRAGAWTVVQVVLEAVPPPQLGYVQVKDFSHSGLQMLR